ncbi:hypothetical protein [Methylobacterium sp. A54F]
MSDEIERLGLLLNLHELAITRLFEAVPEGAAARRSFIADVRRLLDDTRALQPHGPAAQTYEALLRRFDATGPDDGALGVTPTPERGLPPAGAGA